MLGYHQLPGADPNPGSASPWDQASPGPGTPTGAQIPLPRDKAPPRGQTPPQQTATVADSTHPTGMHSCFPYFCRIRRIEQKNWQKT